MCKLVLKYYATLWLTIKSLFDIIYVYIENLPNAVTYTVYVLGAICGSARSMDLRDPWIALWILTSRRNPWIPQGSCVRDLPIYRFFATTLP